jgi:hypothetical protein
MAMQVAGPVRGTYNAEGRFFAVAGNTLFQITAAGVSVPLGTVPGVGRVSFSHNQITNGNEILVNNGTSGYIYNTVTQVFERITDTSYPGGLRAVFINNRFVQIEPARRYLFNSALADGLSYTALDRFTSETSPDLAMSIESIGNQLAVFSSTTTEWFEDTGANPQPFRSTGIVADKGAAGPFATAKMDNQLFFLADDGVFYRYQGYNPVRISTKPIEQSIRNKNWFNVFTTVWEDSGYAVCYWTFPDGHTWGYDASSGKWHRRESYGFNRWRLNSLTYWQNAWYGGDFQNGRLWQLDWDYLLEGDQEFESIRACGVISDNQNRVIHERLELVMNTGMVETAPIAFEDQPEGPSITGSAPDGEVGAAYSYAYSPVPGDAPIARTVILTGTLLAGLTWNQSTATISGTPTASGQMDLVIRTYDTNGLFAQVSDSIYIQIGQGPAFGGYRWFTRSSSATSQIKPSVDGLDWETVPQVASPIINDPRVAFHVGDAVIVGGDNQNGAYADKADLSSWATLSAISVSGTGNAPRGAARTIGTRLWAGLGGGARVGTPPWYVDGLAYIDDLSGSWTVLPNVSHGVSAGTPSTTTVDQVGDDIIRVCAFYLLISSDDGATWSDGAILPFTGQAYCGKSNGSRMLIGGTQSPNPRIAWTDDGLTVTESTIPSGFSGIVYQTLPISEDIWLAFVSGTHGDKLWRSEDNGETFEAVELGVSVSFSSTSEGNGDVNAFSGRVVILADSATGKRIFVSDDAGVTWMEEPFDEGPPVVVRCMVEAGDV